MLQRSEHFIQAPIFVPKYLMGAQSNVDTLLHLCIFNNLLPQPLIFPRRRFQHIRNSIIRRFPLKVLSPKRRVSISRKRRRHPTHRVPEIPYRDTHTLLLIYTRPRCVGINLRLDSLCACITR
jgi:hypothetical protein